MCHCLEPHVGQRRLGAMESRDQNILHSHTEVCQRVIVIPSLFSTSFDPDAGVSFNMKLFSFFFVLLAVLATTVTAYVPPKVLKL